MAVYLAQLLAFFLFASGLVVPTALCLALAVEEDAEEDEKDRQDRL